MGVDTYFIYVCSISVDQNGGLSVDSELEWTMNKMVITCWKDN